MQFMQMLEPWPPLSVVGLSFLYVFLPVSLFLYSLVPLSGRSGMLLGISLLFYGLAHPQGLPWLAGAVIVNYGALVLLGRWRKRPLRRRICAWAGVLLNLVFLLTVLSLIQIQSLPLQLGLLVVILSGVDALVEAYRGEGPAEGYRLIPFALYLTFFPRLYAGPLLPYRQFAAQLESPTKLTGRDLAQGLSLHLTGAFKTLIIGGQLAGICSEIQVFSQRDTSVLSTWCLVLTFGFAVYFNFSGFCDMARGLGRLFGLHLPRNFYYPYQSQGIQDFFDRFNGTVAGFIRRTVYRELGEDTGGILADCLNTLIFGMLMGLWFGLRINYMLWGVYLAVFCLLERYLYPRILREIPMLLRRLYSLCVVLSSFTLLAADSPAQSLRHIRNMFHLSGQAVPFATNRILYLLTSNWLVLVLACILATSLVEVAVRALGRLFPRLLPYAATGFCILVLLLFTALSL